jgi:hypothetical protein
MRRADSEPGPEAQRSLPQGPGRCKHGASRTRIPQDPAPARLFRGRDGVPRLRSGARPPRFRPVNDRPRSSIQQQRLEAALRANLKRRKAQARARGAEAPREVETSHDSAGILPDKPGTEAD